MAFPGASNYAGDQRSLRDSGPASSATAMVSTTAYQQGRAVFIDCTVVGSASFTFADTSTLTFTFPAIGIYEFNWAITSYTAGTATVTVYNLY